MRVGFTKDWVTEAISSAMRWYGKQCRKELDAGPPLNCPEHVDRSTRMVKHLLAKSNWFQKDSVKDEQDDDQVQTNSKPKRTCKRPKNKPESVLFVPFTHEGRAQEVNAADR